MALALAFVLKIVSVRLMPAGGGVSLASVAPLWAYAMRHGPRSGALVGACFGALQLLLRPQVVHWAQALLDYPVAFSSAGLAGLPLLPPAAACVLAACARYAAHVASGVVFWSSAAPPGPPIWSYSMTYNLYVFPDAVIAAIALAAIARRLRVEPSAAPDPGQATKPQP